MGKNICPKFAGIQATLASTNTRGYTAFLTNMFGALDAGRMEYASHTKASKYNQHYDPTLF